MRQLKGLFILALHLAHEQYNKIKGLVWLFFNKKKIEEDMSNYTDYIKKTSNSTVDMTDYRMNDIRVTADRMHKGSSGSAGGD